MRHNVIIFLVHPNSPDEVYAYMPDDFFSWSNHGQALYTSYAHMGQHSSCSRMYAEESRLATPEEYKDLLEEMRNYGPENEQGYKDYKVANEFNPIATLTFEGRPSKEKVEEWLRITSYICYCCTAVCYNFKGDLFNDWKVKIYVNHLKKDQLDQLNFSDDSDNHNRFLYRFPFKPQTMIEPESVLDNILNNYL